MRAVMGALSRMQTRLMEIGNLVNDPCLKWRRPPKGFQCPETFPLDVAGKGLPSPGDAGSLNKALRTSLTFADQDFGAVKESADGIGMCGFDDENIDCEPANNGGRRLHPEISITN